MNKLMKNMCMVLKGMVGIIEGQSLDFTKVVECTAFVGTHVLMFVMFFYITLLINIEYSNYIGIFDSPSTFL